MCSRKETDVGMSEYISKHKGFSGVIKMRYQDFLVNEIDEDGNIVHLTDLSCNSLQNESSTQSPEEICDLSTKLSAKDREELDKLVASKEGVEEVFVHAGASKQERTEVHKAVRLAYPELESETINNEDGEKVIRVKKSSGDSRSRNNRRGKKQICKFVLHKQNTGTMEAINMISSRLKLQRSQGFQYAGTKDKRAVTTQWVTGAFAPERLSALNKMNSNLKLGNFLVGKRPLQLGDLKGNHFTVLIRNVTGSDESIQSAFESFSKNGFINYFGMQRFGTTDVSTYEVGIAVMKYEWQKVVDLLLSPRDDQKSSGLKSCLDEYALSGDAETALNHLRFRNCIEGNLLKGLSKYGKSQPLQAITTIPRNTRMMYVHSYQSYVWNRVASKRLTAYGLSPVVGDLVSAETYQRRIGECNQDELSEGTNGPPSKKPRTSETEFIDYNVRHGHQAVKILKEDEIKMFSIHDILLPLPGHDIIYPDNDVKTWYRDIINGDGIEFEKNMVHKVKDYSLPGAYRNLVVCPARVTYKTVRYNDYKVPLLLTDVEKLNGVEEPRGVENGEYNGLRVEFSLPTSSYATVALREILKADMSIAAQKEQNKEHGVLDEIDQKDAVS